MSEGESIRIRSMTLGERLLSLGLRCLPVKHGKHRALDWLCRRAWNRDVLRVWVPFAGKRLRISVDELVGWHFAVLHSFDPEVVEILVAAASGMDDFVFWDIGANKGACSYGVAAALPGARIVAIEPQSALAPDLEYNLGQVCAGRHYLIRSGIGEQDETLELAIPESNTGRASLHISGDNEGVRVESISIVRADRVADESGWGWPSIVKIDVEGHESAVIRSLQGAFVNQSIKTLVFECRGRDRDQFKEIYDVVVDHDYVIYGVTKSVFSTRLKRVEQHDSAITDYVIVAEGFAAASGLVKLLDT